MLSVTSNHSFRKAGPLPEQANKRIKSLLWLFLFEPLLTRPKDRRGRSSDNKTQKNTKNLFFSFTNKLQKLSSLFFKSHKNGKLQIGESFHYLNLTLSSNVLSLFFGISISKIHCIKWNHLVSENRASFLFVTLLIKDEFAFKIKNKLNTYINKCSLYCNLGIFFSFISNLGHFSTLLNCSLWVAYICAVYDNNVGSNPNSLCAHSTQCGGHCETSRLVVLRTEW